jgi:hypothetical protein
MEGMFYGVDKRGWLKSVQDQKRQHRFIGSPARGFVIYYSEHLAQLGYTLVAQ